MVGGAEMKVEVLCYPGAWNLFLECSLASPSGLLRILAVESMNFLRVEDT